MSINLPGMELDLWDLQRREENERKQLFCVIKRDILFFVLSPLPCTANCFKPEARPISVGIGPLILLWYKYKTFMLLASNSSRGKVPVKSECPKLMYQRFWRRPSSDGIWPLKSLLTRYSFSSLCSCATSVGNVPLRIPDWILSSWMEDNSPSSLGKVPWKKLSKMARNLRLDKFPNSVGIVPVKRVL